MKKLENNQPWQEATLEEILPLKYGKARSTDVGYKRPGTKAFGSNGAFGEPYDRALTEKPSIIVGRKGAAGAVHYSNEPCWPIDTAYYTEGSDRTYLPFFRYLLESLKLGSMDRSTAIPSLGRDDYNARKVRFPADPKDQRRIVAEIEKQFTRLDAGVAALRRVQANLKRYRAAVLKAACEGRLVPAESSTRNPTSNSWRHTELGEVVTFSQGLQVPVPDQRLEPARDDVPFLRIVNYTQRDDDFRYISNPGEKYFVKEDDVVMVRYGTPGFVGRGYKGVIANNLFRVIPQSSISKEYLFYFLKSQGVADLIRSRQKGGTMQAISFGQLKDIPIAIPPLAEQKRIVAEVERRLSVIDELETLATANLTRATRLRQSILQQAFSGQL